MGRPQPGVGGREAGSWTDDSETDNRMRQEIQTNDESRHTVRERQQQGQNIHSCSFTNTRKEIKHETTEKSSRILNIN